MAFKTKLFRYTVMLEADPTGGFVATVPSLPGCVTQGDSIDDTLIQTKDAIISYLAVLREDGDPIPEESNERTIADVSVMA